MRPPKVLSASSICSDRVWNNSGEALGAIEEIMIDVEHGSDRLRRVVFWRVFGLWRQAVRHTVERSEAGCRQPGV